MSKTIETAISNAIIISLTNDLPIPVAEKFKIDTNQFKEFLYDYLKEQFDGIVKKPLKEPDTKKECPKKQAPMRIVRDPTTKKWMVAGTNMYVASQKNHAIIGSIQNDGRLNNDEVELCKKNGWCSF